MKKVIVCMLAAVIFAFCTTAVWAATFQTVNVNATVPVMAGGVTVSISKVPVVGGVDGTWILNQSSISFGTLIFDTVNHIFLPDNYYAVDVGVTDNSTPNWAVTHTRASLGALDSKVNVSFVKQTSATAFTPLQKVSFGNSQGVSYTKAQLAGGWLRIYYGIGTGSLIKPDATDVTPIGMDTPAGTYTGSVKITLTP